MTATRSGPGLAGSAPRRRTLNTPATLRALLAGLVLLSLAWGAFGGWVASQHSSAAGSLVTVDEPLSLDARQMYEAIADADVTITAAYLASAQPPLSELQHYRGDIQTAESRLSALQAASGDRGNQAASGNQAAATATALDAIAAGLPAYTGDAAAAESMYADGFPLTGGSFLQVASEEAHLVLLPNAKTVFTQENDALTAASGQATGLPTIIAALLLAVTSVCHAARVPEVVEVFAGLGIARPAAEGLLSTPRWAMDRALEELDQAYGGIERYLLGPAGMPPDTLTALRTSLTS